MRTAQANIERRRAQVNQLWIRGVGVRAIAHTLEVDPATVSRDLKAIREELVREHAHDVERARARALAVLHQVEVEAWRVYHKVDERSVNRIGSLNTILSAEREINRICGVTSPEAGVQVASNMQVVFMIPTPDALPAVVEAFPDFPAPKDA
jgi:hypothetical protein